MRVCIHRGASEIGGNCIEVESQGAHIVLDVGRPLSATDDEHVEIAPILGEGLLGVIVSHGHQDHWGLIDQLPDDTPVYIGAATAAILKEAAFFTKGAAVTPAGLLENRETFQLGPFTITPYLVDHSAFDAHSFLIEADGKRLFYSADLRVHGAKASLVNKLINDPPKDIDVLLLEGTSVPAEGDPKPHGGSERQVARRIAQTIARTNGMVFVAYSSQNIDRMVQVYRATIAANREFVMDLYTASVAAETGNKKIPQPGPEWPHVRVYVPLWQRIKVKESGEFERVGGAVKAARIYDEELAASPSKFVTKLSLSTLRALAKARGVEKAHAVWSLWPGYLEEDTRMTTELAKLGIPLSIDHTSGHATVADLTRIAIGLAAKRVVPIHTFGSQRFAAFFRNVELHADDEWWEV